MDKKKIKPEVKKTAKQYLDLFYMTPSEVTARELADLLQDKPEFTIELWEEMNVLEIELHNKNTVDFEPVALPFQDPSDADFVKNRIIKTVFAINFEESDLPVVKECFETIINRYPGFLCSDSADFHPVYIGSLAKPEDPEL